MVGWIVNSIFVLASVDYDEISVVAISGSRIFDYAVTLILQYCANNTNFSTYIDKILSLTP